MNKEKPMRMIMLAAATAMTLAVGLSGANAAPVGAAAINDSASASTLAQPVWWHHWHHWGWHHHWGHCWWRYGYRHCD